MIEKKKSFNEKILTFTQLNKDTAMCMPKQ